MPFDPVTGEKLSDKPPVTPAADETSVSDEPNDNEPTPKDETSEDDKTPKTETVEEVKKRLNKENADIRRKYKDKLDSAEKTISEFKSSQKAELVKNGEFKKLYEDATSRLDEMAEMPKQLESLTKENEKYKEIFSGMLDKKKKGLTEAELALMEGKSLLEQLSHIEKYHANPSVSSSSDTPPPPQGGNMAVDEWVEAIEKGDKSFKDIKDADLRKKVMTASMKKS